MPDLLHIGVMNPTRTDLVYTDAGTNSIPTGGLNLNSTSSGVQLVRDTFKVQAPERRAQFSNIGRRFGGDFQSAETHGNGAVGGQFYTQKTTANDAIALWESLIDLAEEIAINDYFIKWQPEGATNPVFYQVRGSASWEANYRALAFSSNKTVVFDVSWPVAPLARGAATTFTAANSSFPSTFDVTVPGTAPGLLDLEVQQTGTGIDFFMVGWTSAPSASTNPVAPFGIVPAFISAGGASGASYLTFSTRDSTNTLVTTGTGIYAQTATPNRLAITTPSTTNTYRMGIDINPALMVRDDFTKGEIQLEVWGRFYVPQSAVLTMVTSLEPRFSTGAASRYTAEYGASGKSVKGRTTSQGGSGWQFVKLGTVQAAVDKNNQATYTLQVKTNFFSAGVSAEFAVDYLAFVPARQRALTPTGRPADTSYPKFIIGETGVTKIKTVRNDLSGWLRPTGGTMYPDSGLGGQLLELPSGTSRIFVKSMLGVPDDSTIGGASTTAISADAAQTLTVSGTIIPRYYLARGT